ncbi:hypothetical protein SETIT_4G074200v2 [Setaria italica]|uniref:Uncharacterized protein n=2 Tax=Setaria TaxID=4554 RepID=A0A368QRW3_SETIT|nr:hypothetical protein SETIT_4G074200v2 [Setaria italica]TKW20225.1 hypothetical protein SEVIR_4G072000v2 [Setaria viridis]
MAAAAAAPPAGAAAPPPPPAAAVAASRPAWTRLSARVALATALFVLGCAAAALAFFAMTLPPADSRILGSCAPTDAEAAGLRAASEKLLLAASAQVLGATVALLVPARPVAVSGCFLGSLTASRAYDVLWMLVACHGHVHGALAAHCWVFFVLLWVALLVGIAVSIV